MVRKKQVGDDEQKLPDPEVTRIAFPELTRCDHCGVLDARTQPTILFTAHPGDGWNWLHPECAREFVLPQCRQITDWKGRPIGAQVQLLDDERESILRYSWGARTSGMEGPADWQPAPPNPPPGWLRSRFGRS
jgi:hypothetical protein